MSGQPRAGRLFGSSIRKARLDRGWTQEQLAENAGLSRPTIARMETDGDVSTSTLAKVTAALGLTIKIESSG